MSSEREGAHRVVEHRVAPETANPWGGNPDDQIEDYPVMTRDTVGFSLQPDGFFDQNAALDAP